MSGMHSFISNSRIYSKLTLRTKPNELFDSKSTRFHLATKTLNKLANKLVVIGITTGIFTCSLANDSALRLFNLQLLAFVEESLASYIGSLYSNPIHIQVV